MQPVLLTDVIAPPSREPKVQINLDRCAEVSARAADLAAIRSALDASPATPVKLNISFDDASSYGVVRIWQIRDVDRDGQRLVAMDGQIVEMGSDGFSYPITVQESCTVLLPSISLTKNSSCACYLSSPVAV